MHAELDRFYALLEQLRSAPNQGRTLASCTGRLGWPARGVYFFAEPGEMRCSASDVPRVVRVGTHAVSAGSKATLWGRLRAHRGGLTGGGNHRGSIFRLHVGAALLARDAATLASWGTGSTARSAVRAAEASHEQRVSATLGAMSVLWVSVDDEPGPASTRAFIERNAIALLSNRLDPIDTPSPAWLGRYSTRPEIGRSGLWNLNHVDALCDVTFLDALEQAIERMNP